MRVRADFLAVLATCGCLVACADKPDAVLTSRQECLGVTSCVSVEKDLVALKSGQHVIQYVCPASTPYLWNWDAERHRDVTISLVSETSTSVVLSVNDQDAKSLSTVKIFLGCSTDDPSARSFRFIHAASGDQS
jgi:hypothetical protein